MDGSIVNNLFKKTARMAGFKAPTLRFAMTVIRYSSPADFLRLPVCFALISRTAGFYHVPVNSVNAK
jgi:hypothetical protein